jgi:hypothetical protein
VWRSAVRIFQILVRGIETARAVLLQPSLIRGSGPIALRIYQAEAWA